MTSRYDPDRHHRRSIRLKDYDYTQSGAYFITICVHDRSCLFGEVTANEMCQSDAGRIVQASWDALPRHYRHVRLDAFVVMPNHIHGIVMLVDDATDTGVGAAVGDGIFDTAGLPQSTENPAGVGAGFDLPATSAPDAIGKPAPAAHPQPMATDYRLGNGAADAADSRAVGSDEVFDGPGDEAADVRRPFTEAADVRRSFTEAADIDRLAGGAGLPIASRAEIAGRSKPAPTPHGLSEIVRAFKTFSARRVNRLRKTPGVPLWQRNYYEHIIRDEADLNRIRQYIADNPGRWLEDSEYRPYV